GPAPGKPRIVSKNDTEVKKAVLIATYSFNNKSNDAFFFKASAIDDAQRQIVKGIKYILKVEISRTVCKKRDPDADLANCGFQPKHELQQKPHQDVLCKEGMSEEDTENTGCLESLWIRDFSEAWGTDKILSRSNGFKVIDDQHTACMHFCKRKS
ncbi:cystatin-F-like, partial [Silurus meridionalis]